MLAEAPLDPERGRQLRREVQVGATGVEPSHQRAAGDARREPRHHRGERVGGEGQLENPAELHGERPLPRQAELLRGRTVPADGPPLGEGGGARQVAAVQVGPEDRLLQPLQRAVAWPDETVLGDGRGVIAAGVGDERQDEVASVGGLGLRAASSTPRRVASARSPRSEAGQAAASRGSRRGPP